MAHHDRSERHPDQSQKTDTTARTSGAPEAGGATTRGSLFGGKGPWPSFLRAVARMARAVEGEAYRRLRDLDRTVDDTSDTRGRPHRVKGAATAPYAHQQPHPTS